MDGDEGARGMDAACWGTGYGRCWLPARKLRFLCASTECACLLKEILMLDLNTCLLVLFALILAAVMKPLRTWCLLHISRGTHEQESHQPPPPSHDLHSALLTVKTT